jgi:tetratricopeptide (TPR) repeat protein
MTRYLAAVRERRTPGRLFPLLHHFEGCGDHGNDDALKREMARHYAAAGRAAHRQSSYDQALKWCLAGKALFPDEIWRDDAALAWELCRCGAECACLTGDYAAADRLFDEAEAHAPDPGARFDMEMVKIASLQARDAHEAALALGRRMLARLGHALPERISAMKLAWTIFRVWGRCRRAM